MKSCTRSRPKNKHHFYVQPCWSLLDLWPPSFSWVPKKPYLLRSLVRDYCMSQLAFSPMQKKACSKFLDTYKMARDRQHICQAQSTIGTSTVCIRMCTNTMQRDPSTASWSPVGLLGPGESNPTKEAIDRGSPLHVFSFDDPHYQTWRKNHGRWNCRSSHPACVCLASSRHLAVMRTFHAAVQTPWSSLALRILTSRFAWPKILSHICQAKWQTSFGAGGLSTFYTCWLWVKAKRYPDGTQSHSWCSSMGINPQSRCQGTISSRGPLDRDPSSPAFELTWPWVSCVVFMDQLSVDHPLLRISCTKKRVLG